MNKKLVMVAGGSVVALSAGAIFLLTQDKPGEQNTDVNPITTEAGITETVEYGADVASNVFVVNTAEGAQEYSFENLKPAVDTKKVGTAEYTLKLEDAKEVKVKVNVKDTKEPVFEGVKEEFTFKAGTDVEKELTKTVKAKDPVDGDIEVNFDIKEDSENQFTVTATAKDVNDNTATQTFKVNVEKEVAKETKPAETKPVAQPVEPKPAETKPAAQPKPSETKPAAKPVEPKPAPKPAEPKPAPKPKPAEPKPAPKPAEPKPAPKPVEEEDLSSQWTQFKPTGSVPAGAKLISKEPSDYYYSYSKKFPGGAVITNVRVAGDSDNNVNVIIYGKDEAGDGIYAVMTAGGQLSFYDGYPTLNQDDWIAMEDLAYAFFKSHK